MTDGPYTGTADMLADLTRLATAMIELAQPTRGAPSPVADITGGGSPFRPRADEATAWIATEWATLEKRGQSTLAAGRFIPWLHMAVLFRLSRLEQTLVLLALLPQIDPRYGVILSALGGQPADEAVSLSAALAVLGGPAARPLLRGALAGDATLLRWRLLELSADTDPLTERGGYRLAAPLGPFLLGSGVPRPAWARPLPEIPALDGKGQGPFDHLFLDPAAVERAQAILRQFQIEDKAGDRGEEGAIGGYLLRVQSVDGLAAEGLCAALFTSLGLGCVRLDGREVRRGGGDFADRLAALCRDLLLSNRVLVLTEPQGLSGDGVDTLLPPLLEMLFISQRYVAVINGSAWRLSDLAHGFSRHRVVPLGLTLSRPDAALRGQIWERGLARQGLKAPPVLLERLATAYQLTATQITTAVKEAAAQCLLGGEVEGALVAACRAQAEREELAVAREIRSAWRLADVVLPPETAATLQEVLLHAHHRDQVMETWGFSAKTQEGRNLSILFHGPSGTGKTMAASALANELGLGLYRIDLAAVLSKYIGETEQRLAQLFDQAETMNIVLFFDEAESLFARRTEAHNANDRHANLQTGYLLQRIETYPGIVILSTNLLNSLDPAFIRRFPFIIQYPFPGPEQRLTLWRSAFPAGVPQDGELDHELLAEKAVLTGGHIREAAVAAAMYAAAEGKGVRMDHVLKGVRREYQKLGKVFTDRDFRWAEEE